MFKLVPAPVFEAPVPLTVPGLDVPETIRIKFRHKSAQGLAAWFEDNKAGSAVDGLDQVIESWSGVVGADGAEVPYSREMLDRLLYGYPMAAGEIIRAYTRALTESRVKN